MRSKVTQLGIFGKNEKDSPKSNYGKDRDKGEIPNSKKHCSGAGILETHGYKRFSGQSLPGVDP